MTGPSHELTEATTRLAHAAIAEARQRPAMVGICGTQASGKSTLVRAVGKRLEADGIAHAILSIDDLYLTRAEREQLARDVHPMLVTRGPPGTHDVALGHEVLDALGRGEAVALPRFDKARDDRRPRSEWPTARKHCRVVLLEGWCVGARPQSSEALVDPVNDLESARDPDAIWRRFANDQLDGTYRGFFARIDKLALLAAPGFEVVFDWRLEQERHGDGGNVMSPEDIRRFIAHYERITRHILEEMPGRADLLVALDHERRSHILSSF